MVKLHAAIGSTKQEARAQIEAIGPGDDTLTPALNDVLTWNGSAWVPGSGSGVVTGSPNALVFINGAGTAAVTDLNLVAAPVDQFGRAQIRDTRLPGTPGTGAVFRQGAWEVDGDALPNVQGEGLVVYGPAPNGLMDGSNGTFGRVKYDRFGIRLVTGGVDVGYGWRADLTEMFFRDDTGVKTLNITRASGDTYVGGNLTIHPSKSLDVSSAGVLQIGTGTATGISIGYAAALPANDPMVFINQGGVQLHGSNAGIQYASARANRGSIRTNQYGANTGFPGITGFKSRGATIGTLGAVVVGDGIFRATAIGVCPDNSLPLSGLMTFYVESTAATYISTSWEIELNPPEGPTNGHVPMFGVSPNGVPLLREQPNRGAGVATLGAAGTVTIANSAVSATSRFVLTVQDGGPAPTGIVYQSARVAGTSFTITSTAGAADAGVIVYWQIWGQTVLSRP